MINAELVVQEPDDVAPSDHRDLAEWLLEQGIRSMSLNPDTVVDTWIRLGEGAGQSNS